MTCSDPVADFLTRIRNAHLAKHRYVDIPWSQLKENIAKILEEQGLIERLLIKREGTSGQMRLLLKYNKKREAVIQGLKRYSRPGCRRYVKHDQIPRFFGGLGLAIVSTSKGVISGFDARKQKVGGELLCLVW